MNTNVNLSKFYKTLLILFLGLISVTVFPITAQAQVFNCKNCTIYLDGKGTGKTTGDIVYLTIYNPNDQAVKGEIGPYYIPSDGKYQPYLIPDTKQVDINAHDSLRIFLNGYCADITKKPVPSGYPMIPVEQWIALDKKNSQVIYADWIKIDPVKYPELIGPIYLGALDAITRTYDSLKGKGLITTPFSGNPEKEREAIVQQDFWRYTATTNQAPYTKDQFKERTYSQYEENSHIKVMTLTTDQKQSLDNGIDAFWSAFELVGEQAKVIHIADGEKKPEVIINPNPTNAPNKTKKDSIIADPTYTKTVPVCKCSHCNYSTKFIITDSATREVYLNDTIPPNSTITIQPPPLISNDCPKDCNPRQSGRLTIQFFECGKPILYRTPTDSFKSKVGKSGIIKLEYEAFCYCDGKFCDKKLIREEIKIRENDCCEKIRCKKDNFGQLIFINPDDPTSQVIIKGNTLIFYPGIKNNSGLGHTETFDFNLEDIFCTLSDDQIMSQVLLLSSSRTSNGKTNSRTNNSSIRVSGVTKWKVYLDSANNKLHNYRDHTYSLQFSKMMTVNNHTEEVQVTMSIDEKTCIATIQLIIGNKVYEFKTK